MIEKYFNTAKLELLKMLEEKAKLEEQIAAHRIAINTMQQLIEQSKKTDQMEEL